MAIEVWDRSSDGALRLHQLVDARVAYDEDVVLLRLCCIIGQGVESFVQLRVDPMHALRLASALTDAVGEMEADRG